MQRSSKNAYLLIGLFSVTLFLSAALMFALQPMVGKMLLPLVGGTPSGWLVAMTFFQLILLFGYYLAHKLSSTSVRTQGIVLCLMLIVGLVTQPIHLTNTYLDTSAAPNAISVFTTLFTQLVLPFTALSMLSPSLQRLFASTSGPRAKDPYFLFSASNLGSFAGLLLYPLWIERTLGLYSQATLWRGGYVLLIVLCGVCLLKTKHAATTSPLHEQQPAPPKPLSWKIRGRWILLSFIPTSLLMGVSDQIMIHMGSMPLFWIIPLALYLLTFVLTFAHKPFSFLVPLAKFHAASVGWVLFLFLLNPIAPQTGAEHIFIPLIAFFLSCLKCHQELAASRPDRIHLTAFYLTLTFGGFLGGAFNTFVAPFLFSFPLEFILVLAASCAVTSFSNDDKKLLSLPVIAKVLCVIALYGLTISLPTDSELSSLILSFLYLLLLIALLFVSFTPKALAALALILIPLSLYAPQEAHLLDIKRNFLGITRVYERTDGDRKLRILYNGAASHTMEQTKPTFDVVPHGFFGKEGAIENIMALKPLPSVAIIGLGGGAMLCYQGYQGSQHHYVGYEINPSVIEMATKWFDFFDKCDKPEIRIGDARVLLNKAKDEKYDAIIIDVFASDNIPLHLLTAEAFQVYFDHLADGGVIAFHVYSVYYDMRKPISALKEALGVQALYKLPHLAEKEYLWKGGAAIPTPWIVIARDKATIAPLREKGWEDLPAATERVWTDDYSDLLSALK